MKILPLVALSISFFIFQSCRSTANISGRYSNVYAGMAGEEFKFSNSPNIFEYYSKSEGMVREFSLGNYEGVLLATTPLIDTLYSRVLQIGDLTENHKTLFLKFNLARNSFYRTKLTDTLVVKNNHKLVWHNKKFKQIFE